jgi:nicotinamide-nucleotide adenylyltransferase
LNLSRGLFIGRFQPFHLGHKSCIDFALSKVEDLVIIVGSSERSHELRNPFTGGERILMIKESLKTDHKIDHKRILIIPLADINIHSIWSAYVGVMVPKYETLFTNDTFTKLLFEQEDIEIVEPPAYNRMELSGTVIRKKMLDGTPWKHLVPAEALQVIQYVDGESRLKQLSMQSRGPGG